MMLESLSRAALAELRADALRRARTSEDRTERATLHALADEATITRNPRGAGTMTRGEKVFEFDRGERVEFVRDPGRVFEVLSRFRASSGEVSLGEPLTDGRTGWRPCQADPRDIRKMVPR